MIKIDIFSAKGTKLKQAALPKYLEEKLNDKLLAQAIHVYRDRAHFGTHKTKTRGEIKLTKAKWYKQKGTGGARHGARSAPLFVGGGKAHGPTGVDRRLTLPKKMRRKALAIALSQKAKDGRVVAVDGISKLKKTKEAQKLINKMTKDKMKKITFVLSRTNLGSVRFLRNIKNVEIVSFNALNAYKVHFGGFLVLDKEVLKK